MLLADNQGGITPRATVAPPPPSPPPAKHNPLEAGHASPSTPPSAETITQHLLSAQTFGSGILTSHLERSVSAGNGQFAASQTRSLSYNAGDSSATASESASVKASSKHGSGPANLRGISVSTSKMASIDRESGAYEIGSRSSLSYASISGTFKTEQSASLKVTHGEEEQKPETEADKKHTIRDNTSATFASTEGSAAASLASKTFSSKYASLTVSAFGADASGKASLGLTKDGFQAAASGSAEAYLVHAHAEAQFGPAKASADATVGAGVDGSAAANFNPLKGDASIDTDVNAFAGARATETGDLSLGGATATENGNVGAGIGVGAQADAGIKDGKVKVDFGLDAYLGVGAGFNVSFQVNVPKVAGEVTGAVESGAKDVANGAKDVAHDVSKAISDVTSWF